MTLDISTSMTEEDTYGGKLAEAETAYWSAGLVAANFGYPSSQTTLVQYHDLPETNRSAHERRIQYVVAGGELDSDQSVTYLVKSKSENYAAGSNPLTEKWFTVTFTAPEGAEPDDKANVTLNDPGLQAAACGITCTNNELRLNPPPISNGKNELHLLPIDLKWEAKPEFANLDDNPDPWTNEIHGKRIMVSAPEDDPGGDMRRELNVKVSIPGYANQPVYLKVFDVDDPSTVSDPSQVLDPNGDAGDDNMHPVGLGDNWGHFIPQAAKKITVTLDSSGEATATFKVNQQPGNNYRVAVAIEDADLNVLQVTNPGSQGFVTPDDKSVSGFKGAITPMLTVWRKLHIEVDSMKAVTNPKDSPDRVDAVGDHWATDTSGLQNRQRLYLAGSLPEGNNFYERGRLKAGGAEYKIVESGSNWVTLSTSVQSVPHGFIGPVEIYDDDDRGLAGPPLPKPSLITQGVKAIFKRAYIAIDERTQNPTKTIPFKLYTSVEKSLLADSSLNDAIDTNGDDWGGFWNHYLIAAYQPHKSAANDPAGPVIRGATLRWTPFFGQDCGWLS